MHKEPLEVTEEGGDRSRAALHEANVVMVFEMNQAPDWWQTDW